MIRATAKDGDSGDGYVTVAKDFRIDKCNCAISFDQLPFPCLATLRGYLKVTFALLIIATMLPIRRASGILRRYAVVDRVRWASTAAPSKDKFKIVVLGGGASFAIHDLTQSLLRLLPPTVIVLPTEPADTRIGSGGLSVAQQLYDRFDAAGKRLKAGDIAIVDAAEYHYYQVGHGVVHPEFADFHSPKSKMRSIFRPYSPDGTSPIGFSLSPFPPPPFLNLIITGLSSVLA